MVSILWFHEAPDDIRALSPHCGDEDYVVIGKDRFRVEVVAEKLDVCGDMPPHQLPSGDWLVITAHA